MDDFLTGFDWSTDDDEPTTSFGYDDPVEVEQPDYLSGFDWSDDSEPETTPMYARPENITFEDKSLGWKIRAGFRRSYYTAHEMAGETLEAGVRRVGDIFGQDWSDVDVTGWDEWAEGHLREDPTTAYTLEQAAKMERGESIGMGYEALESAVPTLFGLGATAVSPWVGIPMLLAYYTGSSDQENYEKARATGRSHEEASRYARDASVGSGLIETLNIMGDLAMMKIGPGKFVPAPIRRKIGNNALNLFRTKPADVGRTILGIGVVESATEVSQAEWENYVDRKYGFTDQRLTAGDRAHLIGTTSILSVLLGPLSIGMNVNNKRKLVKALDSRNPEVQKQAADMVAKELNNRGYKQEAALWTEYTQDHINRGMPIKLDTDLVAAGENVAQMRDDDIRQGATGTEAAIVSPPVWEGTSVMPIEQTEEDRQFYENRRQRQERQDAIRQGAAGTEAAFVSPPVIAETSVLRRQQPTEDDRQFTQRQERQDGLEDTFGAIPNAQGRTFPIKPVETIVGQPYSGEPISDGVHQSTEQTASAPASSDPKLGENLSLIQQEQAALRQQQIRQNAPGTAGMTNPAVRAAAGTDATPQAPQDPQAVGDRQVRQGAPGMATEPVMSPAPTQPSQLAQNLARIREAQSKARANRKGGDLRRSAPGTETLFVDPRTRDVTPEAMGTEYAMAPVPEGPVSPGDTTGRPPKNIADATEAQREDWRQWRAELGVDPQQGVESVADGTRPVGLAAGSATMTPVEEEQQAVNSGLYLGFADNGMGVYGKDRRTVNAFIRRYNKGLSGWPLSKALGYTKEQYDKLEGTSWADYVASRAAAPVTADAMGTEYATMTVRTPTPQEPTTTDIAQAVDILRAGRKAGEEIQYREAQEVIRRIGGNPDDLLSEQTLGAIQVATGTEGVAPKEPTLPEAGEGELKGTGRKAEKKAKGPAVKVTKPKKKTTVKPEVAPGKGKPSKEDIAWAKAVNKSIFEKRSDQKTLTELEESLEGRDEAMEAGAQAEETDQYGLDEVVTGGAAEADYTGRGVAYTATEIARARDIYRRAGMKWAPEKKATVKKKPKAKPKPKAPMDAASAAPQVIKDALDKKFGEDSAFTQAVEKEYQKRRALYEKDPKNQAKPDRTTIARELADAIADRVPSVGAQVIENVEEFLKATKQKQEKRTINGVTWIIEPFKDPVGKDKTGGEWRVQFLTKSRQQLWKGNELIGTFGSRQEAMEGAADTSDYDVAGKGKARYVTMDGERLHDGYLRAAWMGDLIISIHSMNPNIPVDRLVYLLNNKYKGKGRPTVQELLSDVGMAVPLASRKNVTIDNVDAMLNKVKIQELFTESPMDIEPEPSASQIELEGLTENDKLYNREGTIVQVLDTKAGKAVKYLKKLMNMMGLDSVNLIAFDIDSARQNLGSTIVGLRNGTITSGNRTADMAIEGHLRQWEANGKWPDGAITYDAFSNTSILYLDGDNFSNMDQWAQAQLIQHEGGHLVSFIQFLKAPLKTQQAIVEEYVEHIKKQLPEGMQGITVGQIIANFRPMGLALDEMMLTPEGALDLSIHDPAWVDHMKYVTSFEEYLADQGAKWFSSNKQAKSLTEKFFKKLADVIADFWHGVTGTRRTDQVNPEFKKWYDEMAKGAEDYRLVDWVEQSVNFDTFVEFAKGLSTERNRMLGFTDGLSDADQIAYYKRAETAQEKSKLAATTGTVAYSDAEAMAILEQSHSRRNRNLRGLKLFRDNMSTFFKDALVSGIDRLENISPQLGRFMNRYALRINRMNAAYKIRLNRWAGAYRSLSDGEKAFWTMIVNSGNRKKVEQFLNAPGRETLKAEFANVQGVLKDIKSRGDKVGIDIDVVDGIYWPRKVADVQGLMAHLASADPDRYAKINAEIAEAKRKAEANKIKWTGEMENDMVNTYLRTGRYNNLMTKPGSLRDRTIEAIDPHMMPYYADSLDALFDHVFEMNNHIATYELIGPKVRKQARERLGKLEQWFDGKRDEKSEEYRMKLEQRSDLIQALNSFGDNSVFQESLAGWLNDNILKGDRYTTQQKEDALKVVRARLLEKGMHGFVNNVRNIGLMSTLGQWTSIPTQLSEIIYAIYRHNPNHAFSGLIKKNGGSRLINATLLDLKNQQLEYQGEEGGTSRWASKLLNATGFSKADITMKETFMSGAVSKGQADVDTQAFRDKWEPYFGKEDFLKLQEALRKDPATWETTMIPDGKGGEMEVRVPSELVLEMAWAEQMRYQPLDTLANPVFYMLGGNWRLLYMLKTFQIRQANAFIRDSWGKMAKGDVKGGLTNLVTLGALIIMAGATVDELRDFILGRERPLSDHIWDNMLGIVLFSRYDMDRIGSEGLGSQVLGNIAPPMPWLDAPTKDIYSWTQGKPGYTTIKQMPFAGNIVYYRLTAEGKKKQADDKKKTFGSRLAEATIRDDKDEVQRIKADIKKFNKSVPEELQMSDRSVKSKITKTKNDIIESQGDFAMGGGEAEDTLGVTLARALGPREAMAAEGELDEATADKVAVFTRFLDDVAVQENAKIAMAAVGERFKPAAAPERGGGQDVGFGHKLTATERSSGKVYDVEIADGVTPDEAKYIMNLDVNKAIDYVSKNLGTKTFNKLPTEAQLLLADYQFNGVYSKFPKFRKALIDGNYEKAVEEHKRYWVDKSGKTKELKKRNDWTKDKLDELKEIGWLT